MIRGFLLGKFIFITVSTILRKSDSHVSIILSRCVVESEFLKQVASEFQDYGIFKFHKTLLLKNPAYMN